MKLKMNYEEMKVCSLSKTSLWDKCSVYEQLGSSLQQDSIMLKQCWAQLSWHLQRKLEIGVGNWYLSRDLNDAIFNPKSLRREMRKKSRIFRRLPVVIFFSLLSATRRGMVMFPYLARAFCQFLELQSGPLCSRWAHTLIKVLIVIIFPKKTNMIPHALSIVECGNSLIISHLQQIVSLYSRSIKWKISLKADKLTPLCKQRNHIHRLSKYL